MVGVAAHKDFRSRPLARACVWSDRGPDSVVPESPSVGSLVPHHLSPRRPRRWRRRRRRPRRRHSPGPEARWTNLTCRTLPVVALIPIPVVGSAPAWVPLITRAPVRAWHRGRLGAGAASQSESEQSQPASHQHACRPFSSRHPPRISRRPESMQAVISATLPVAQDAVPRLATLYGQSTGSRG
jgi:hypothetical protein